MAEEKDPKILAEIKISFDRSLILPVEEGLDFMRAVAAGEFLKESYNTTSKILPTDDEIVLKLIPASKIREIRMEEVLEQKGDDDE